MSETRSKPEFTEVYAYAKKSVRFHINRRARYLSKEIREEIEQSCLERVWIAYQTLDPNKGWPSYIGQHCRGAVLDFMKTGKFDDGLGAASGDGMDLKHRIEVTNDEGTDLDVDEITALFGIHAGQQGKITGADDEEIFRPDWELVSKMAGKDENLHIVAKVILGYSQEEIAAQMADNIKRGISRERVSQRVFEFFENLDSPSSMKKPWENQVIYALGLSSQYHMPEVDNGEGHDLKPFDLNSPLSFKLARRLYRPNLFDSLDDLEDASRIAV